MPGEELTKPHTKISHAPPEEVPKAKAKEQPSPAVSRLRAGLINIDPAGQ